MNQYAILASAIAFLSIVIVSGTNICDNAPCEPQINASPGREFTISLESNPSTGFEWWTKFDPNYLSLINLTFVGANEISGIIGVAGKDVFTFNAMSAGNTEVIMLLIQPWENGTITERKILPINIVPEAAAPRQAIALGKGTNPYESLGGMATQTVRGTSFSYFTNESVMETPSQAVPNYPEPSRYDLSSLSQKSI
jgi:inhibitor of cysteine peptidase